MLVILANSCLYREKQRNCSVPVIKCYRRIELKPSTITEIVSATSEIVSAPVI